MLCRTSMTALTLLGASMLFALDGAALGAEPGVFTVQTARIGSRHEVLGEAPRRDSQRNPEEKIQKHDGIDGIGSGPTLL